MIAKVADITTQVRIALDQNQVSEKLGAFADTETLLLDEIIASKIPEAVRTVHLTAPTYLLESGQSFADSYITWEHGSNIVGVGMGSVLIPEDFLRLVSFRMSDWDRSVTSVITEDSPAYAMQRSRFAGVRGCPQRPVVAIVSKPQGLTLEFYACSAGNGVHIEHANYLPIPKIVGSDIFVCEKLFQPIVYATAAKVALTIKDAEMAQALMNNCKELMV